MEKPTRHNRDWSSAGANAPENIENTPVQTTLSVHEASLRTRIFQGAGIAVFMMLFRITARENLPPSAMQILLMFLALALGGGVGGAVFYLTDGWRSRGGALRTLANVSSLLAYCLITGGVLVLLFVIHGSE